MESTFQSTPSTRRETFFLAFMLSPLVSFQSTPSTRRETPHNQRNMLVALISIHSLHTEGDCSEACRRASHGYFNPLPPHGGRQRKRNNKSPELTFQSTPSTRRETLSRKRVDFMEKFQSTPSTRRETYVIPSSWIGKRHFNPLPPHGGRPD